MIKMVIFDLDGTLVNTLGGIAGACNHVLLKHGFETRTIDSYMELVGNGLAMTIFRALPEYKKEELLSKPNNFIGDNKVEKTITNNLDVKGLRGEPDFDIPELKSYVDELLEYYKLNPTIDSHLYEGIEEVLNYLDYENIKWGIHTNKTASIAVDVADTFIDPQRYLGLKGPNSDVPSKPNTKGSLDLMKKVPGIKLDEIIYVGDTEVDLKTGRNLGVPVISVTYGFRKRNVLEELKPDYLVAKPIEIINIIKQINRG